MLFLCSRSYVESKKEGDLGLPAPAVRAMVLFTISNPRSPTLFPLPFFQRQVRAPAPWLQIEHPLGFAEMSADYARKLLFLAIFNRKIAIFAGWS